MQTQTVRRVLALTEKTAGFTTDGKPLLALFTAEKRGKDYAATFTAANLARLENGEYFLTVAGKGEETLRFAPQSPTPLRLRKEICAEEGLAVLLWTEREGALLPVAFGISGKVTDHGERIKGEALRFIRSPVYGAPDYISPPNESARESPYQDEAIATENYYERKDSHDEATGNMRGENAVFTGEDCQKEPFQKQDLCPKTDANATNERGEKAVPFPIGEKGERALPQDSENAFFNRKRGEIARLFQSLKKERALCGLVPGGYFAQLDSSPFIYGVITLRETLSPEDIPTLALSEVVTLCYALPVNSPTEEKGKEFCYFLPVKTDGGYKGYLITCQNPLTGNPERISFA